MQQQQPYRPGAEIRRQRGEAGAIRGGLGAVRSRRDNLAQRLERARGVHEDIRGRVVWRFA
jgi:hypothetical protein